MEKELWQLVLYYGVPTERKPVPFFNSFDFRSRQEAFDALAYAAQSWSPHPASSKSWTKAVVCDPAGVAVASHEVAP